MQAARPASSVFSRASFANGDQRYCTYSPYIADDDLGDLETPKTSLLDYPDRNIQTSNPFGERRLERDWDVETVKDWDGEQEDGDSREPGYARSLREENQRLEEEVRRKDEEVKRKEEEIRRKDEEAKKAEQEVRRMREDAKRVAEEDHEKMEAWKREREMLRQEQNVNRKIEKAGRKEEARLKQESLGQMGEVTTRKDQEIDARERALNAREEELKRREEEARISREEVRRLEEQETRRKEQEVEKFRENAEKTRRMQQEANRIAEQARVKQEILRQIEEDMKRKDQEIEERERALKAREEELKKREEDTRRLTRPRLNVDPQSGLPKQMSKDSLSDVPDAIHFVPPEIVDGVSEQEKKKKRQEAINEVIYTERDFVRDMEYLRDVWIDPLVIGDAIPPHRRVDFLTQVFWNVRDIIAVNTRLRDALNRRQESYAVVDCIGDILLEIMSDLSPFVSYGPHQVWGSYLLEKEKASNPAFAQFVYAAERLPESRNLDLQTYLSKPITRLGRYPILLEAVLTHTPSDSSDGIMLPQVISTIRDSLTKISVRSGKMENRLNLLQLHQHLVFKPGEKVNLRLTEADREMVYKGILTNRDGELQVYLFDHALLFTKYVKTKNIEEYKVFRPPIPLQLLLVTAPLDENNAQPQQRRIRRLENMVPVGHVNNRAGHWINFVYPGRKHYNLTLWATDLISQRKWLEMIYKQQEITKERGQIFDTVTLSRGIFSGPNKVNCAAPYRDGFVYGTDDGVFRSSILIPKREPVKVLALLDVTQIDVLGDYQLLIVLSERQVITFPLEALDPLDPVAGLKRAKRISSHTSFFKAGFCLGRLLVCIAKSSQLSCTFKIMEFTDQNVQGQGKSTFKKLLQGRNDGLTPFKEFYIPKEAMSIHFLGTRLCVGCSTGFEVVDLKNLDTQGALDPNDETLEFVRKRKNLIPMAIYRIHNEFLLCYDEFAFYIDKNGRQCRTEFMVHWEGVPTGFALQAPYILAIEPSFVEIRHIETGLMTQVIHGTNMRLLFADTPSSVADNAVHPYPQQKTYGYGYGLGRGEILIASDDRVLALRPAARGIPQPQPYIVDNIANDLLPQS